MQRNTSVSRLQRQASRRHRNLDIRLDGFHVAIAVVVILGIAAIAYGRAYRVSHTSDAPISVSVPDAAADPPSTTASTTTSAP